MLEYLAILMLGVAFGVFTGLVPGIHPNTVIFSTLPFYFWFRVDFLSYMSFVSGMSVAHTFHDFLPAIFLGAPEAESALSALPGGRLALEGRGLEAFDYTVLGGLVSVTVLILVIPGLYLFLPAFYPVLESVMPHVLMFFLLVIVFRSNDLKSSLTVASLSGILGLLSFSAPVNQQFVLVPVFSGIFAVPAVLHAMRSNPMLPVQRHRHESGSGSVRGGVLGVLAGLVAGVFPGLGAAVSTSFLSPLIGSRKEFLAGMGGVNTSDILVSFIGLHLIGQSRSGASVALQAVSTVTLPKTVFLSGMSLVAVSVSVPLAFQVSRRFTRLVTAMDFRLLGYGILAVVLAVTLHLTGAVGLLVLTTSSFIGYAALLSGERAACMSVLIIPAISFYASTSTFI